MSNLKVKDMLFSDRPYEKLLKIGANNLTDTELLAIILKNGSKKENSLELSSKILSKKENGLEGFSYLKEVSIEELKSYNGVGSVKAIILKAVVEIASRINKQNTCFCKIATPKDIYNLLKSEMEDLKTEETKIVLLDTKNKVKSVSLIAKGSINQTLLTAKEILSEPIKQMATSIILVHNHPSGDSSPSRQDINLTKKIKEYSDIFDIVLLDHIIIGKNEYTSIKETNPDVFIGGKLL